MKNYLITYYPCNYNQQMVDTIIDIFTVQLHITKYSGIKYVHIIVESALNTQLIGQQICFHTGCTKDEVQVRRIRSLANTILQITKNSQYDIVTNTLGDLQLYLHQEHKKFNPSEFIRFCFWYWRDPDIARAHPIVRKYSYIPQNAAKTNQERIKQLIKIYTACTGEALHESKYERLLEEFWYLYGYYSYDGVHTQPWMKFYPPLPAASIATPPQSVVASKDDGAMGGVQAARENEKDPSPLYLPVLEIPDDPVAAQTAAPHMFGVSPDDDSAKPNIEQ